MTRSASIFALARDLIGPSHPPDDRVFGGELLGRLHDRGHAAAQKELDQTWQSKALPVLLGAWSYHLKRHGDDAVPLLIQALSEYGTSEIALGFVNSGNKQLDAAGAKWAAEHGFILIERKM